MLSILAARKMAENTLQGKNRFFNALNGLGSAIARDQSGSGRRLKRYRRRGRKRRTVKRRGRRNRV